MTTTFIYFWISFLSLTSLFLAKDLSKSLAITWFIILITILSLFTQDLDLLGSAMLAVYSSVFLYLTFLSMVQNSYESKSFFTGFSNISLYITLIIFVLCLCVLRFTDFQFFTAQPYNILLWTDAFTLFKNLTYSSVFALHLIFYKIFIGDSVLFNLYILIGLILAVLSLLYFKRNDRHLSFFSANNLNVKNCNQVKTVYSFRRQVRRKNNTIVKNNI